MIIAALRKEDLDAAVGLLERSRVSVGGWMHRDVYRAICRSRHAVTVVARGENTVAGIVVVELSRAWLYGHPWLALRILWHRWKQRKAGDSGGGGGVAAGAGPLYHSGAPPAPWKAPGPRVVFIGVDASCRGQGIGKRLYEEMFRELGRRGYPLLRARIAPDNFASLELHRGTGWEMYADDGVVTALRRIGD